MMAILAAGLRMVTLGGTFMPTVGPGHSEGGGQKVVLPTPSTLSSISVFTSC